MKNYAVYVIYEQSILFVWTIYYITLHQQHFKLHLQNITVSHKIFVAVVYT